MLNSKEGSEGFFALILIYRKVLPLENAIICFSNFPTSIAFLSFATMMKEDMVNKDSEPSVCERNGMIPMHEKSEVINQRFKLQLYLEESSSFPFLAASVKKLNRAQREISSVSICHN